MRRLKKLFILFLTATLVIVPFTSAAAQTVSIYLDGDYIELYEKSAFFDTSSGIVMAPLELFSDTLGADVTYSPEEETVLIKRNDSTITFTLGDATVKSNNQNVTLDTAPVESDGVIYLPLRFTVERIGFEVKYNSAESRIDLQTIYNCKLGIKRSDALAIYGTTSVTLPSEKGYLWQVYNTDYTDYTLVGFDGDNVVAYYLGGGVWKLPTGVGSGMKLASCVSIMNSLGYQSSTGSGYTVFTSALDTLTVYYRSSGDNIIYAALYEDAAYGLSYDITPSALRGQEVILADLTNIERVYAGLAPLPADSDVAAAAKAHASDMAENVFFSHRGNDGGGKEERLAAVGFSSCYSSEAIAKAYPNCFAVFASFLSNNSYREILNANFDSIGIGYAYNPNSDGVLYCVQLFYAEQD